MQVKKSNKKIDLTNLSKKRKITKINIYKVANFKNIPKIKQKKIYQRKSLSKRQLKKVDRGLKNERKYKDKSEKKSLKHEQKINKHTAKKSKFQYKHNKNKLLYNKVKPITGTIKTTSKKILQNNEDENAATEGVFKTTYTTSKVLSSKIRSKGKNLTKKIRKKSYKISNIQKKENKNILLKNNLYKDEKFNQKRLVTRILHKNLYYAKHRLNVKWDSTKKFFIELPSKFLAFLGRIVLSIITSLGILLLPIAFFLLIFLLIFGGSSDSNNESIDYVNNIIYPAEGKITSKFGWRDGFYLQDGRWYPRNFHKGIDIANQLGTEIKAMTDGTVTYIDPNSTTGYGKWIEIDHGNNIKTRYAHLSTIKVTLDQKVKIGEVIGLMGSTGNSTGPHLHFEVRKNGEAIDPEIYIANALKNVNLAKLPKEVLRWEPFVMNELKKYNLENYKNVALTIIMLESGGRYEELPDVMQSSESIGLAPNTIDNPVTSIYYGVLHLKSCIEHMNKYNVDIKTMIHSYNFGKGFVEYVSRNGGQWTQELADSFSNMWATKKGWKSYGDKNYVKKFMKYSNN